MPTAPGSLFDLSNWKLTLPTDGGDSGTTADEIIQPTLDTYADTNFTLDGSNRMVLTAPVQGDTTSGSGGTRCELREMEAGAEADWSMATTAPRQLTVTAIYDPSNITDRPQEIVGQIHGASGTPPLYLTYENDNSRLRIFKNGPGFADLLTGITSTTIVTHRWRVAGGRVQLSGCVGDRSNLPATPQYDWPASDFTDGDDCYLKTGAYNKSTVADGGTGSAIAKIIFLELLQNIAPIGNVRVRGGNGHAAATTQSVTMPAGVQVGDRLVVGFVSDTATATASTTSTGWTALGSQAQGTSTNHRLTIFTKVATGSDTLTVALSASVAVEWMTTAMRGDGGTPTLVFANGGSATTGTVTAATGLASGDYTSLVFLGLDNSVALAHTVTPPSGWGNLAAAGTGTDPVFVAEMDRDFSLVTSISPGSATWSNGEQWITGHVIVPIASAGAGARTPPRPRSRRLAALLDM